MNICERRDGKFYPCDDSKSGYENGFNYQYVLNGKGITCKASFCPFCGADIRKPEQKGRKMNEIKDFMHMIGDLASMSDCPNFSDKMRNNSVELMLYINKNTEPEKPLIVQSVEEKMYVVAISGDKQQTATKIHRTILSFAVKAYSAKEAMGIAIEIFRDKKDGYSVEVWEGHEITEENTFFIQRTSTPQELQRRGK